MSSSEIYQGFVPVYDAIPEKWEESRQFLVEQLRRVSNGINTRDRGYYLDTEIITGQLLYPGTTTGTENRSILRKVIKFDALPNSANKALPHGITVNANFTLFRIWGAATNPTTNISIPIPFQQAGSFVNVYMDATNVNVYASADYSGYTRSNIVVEYVQEV
jgi:hypothetical protein